MERYGSDRGPSRNEERWRQDEWRHREMDDRDLRGAGQRGDQNRPDRFYRQDDRGEFSRGDVGDDDRYGRGRDAWFGEDRERDYRGTSGPGHRSTNSGFAYGPAGRRSSGNEPRRQQDNRGRGPKGYRRADSRIEEDVNDSLTEDDEVDASDVQVSVKDCEVTLDGTVGSRSAKRRAEDCADSVRGVQHVQNNLRVKTSSGETTESQAQPSDDTTRKSS